LIRSNGTAREETIVMNIQANHTTIPIRQRAGYDPVFEFGLPFLVVGLFMIILPDVFGLEWYLIPAPQQGQCG